MMVGNSLILRIVCDRVSNPPSFYCTAVHLKTPSAVQLKQPKQCEREGEEGRAGGEISVFYGYELIKRKFYDILRSVCVCVCVCVCV